MIRILISFLLLLSMQAWGQFSSSFTVGGDIDKYYPVIFSDANWSQNRATEIEIGRSTVHIDENWRGSLIAKFRYHTTNFGNGSHFINADIKSSIVFVAGWTDASSYNSTSEIIIWLKGGGTTYYLNTVYNVGFRVHDGIQNPVPFVEQNGVSRTFKTNPELRALANVRTFDHAFIEGNMITWGNVGIGTVNPQERLSVNGNIRAKEVKVETANWPDYVFEDGYDIGSLEKLEGYVKQYKHLPGVPSAREVERDGISVGEINKVLLKKIEELTLHLIEKDRQLKRQAGEFAELSSLVYELKSKIEKK